MCFGPYHTLPHVTTNFFMSLLTNFLTTFVKSKVMISTAVRIMPEDTVYNVAKKIWDDFKIGQSCSVWGTVIQVNPDTQRNQLVEKGQAVVDQLREFDRMENTIDCGKRRKKKTIPDSVGGYLAQKIFIYKREIVNEDIKWSIWRRQ